MMQPSTKPLDPRTDVGHATGTDPAELPVFLSSGGEPDWVNDQAAGDDLLKTDSRGSRPADPAGRDTLDETCPQPFDPFDDPCNYLG